MPQIVRHAGTVRRWRPNRDPLLSVAAAAPGASLRHDRPGGAGSFFAPDAGQAPS